MSNYVTGFHTKDGVKKYDYNALANLPEAGTDITNTVISPNADYAEVGEWADGNPDKENRLGYFVAIAEVGDNTIKIRKATSTDDVRGVSVYNPAFSGNASKNKYGADGELLPQYNYIGVMGIVSVIDNYCCEVGGRCMPADDGTAKKSDNNMGYAVLERVDNKHVLIAIEPGADMIQRVKKDVEALETQLENGGGKGDDGATFTPSVSADGVISWTNNKNLQNPASVNIKGVGISKIEKVSTTGLVDTYRITLTNGNTFDFTVTNGQSGGGSGGGLTPEQLEQFNTLVQWHTDSTYTSMAASISPSSSTYEIGSTKDIKFTWSFKVGTNAAELSSLTFRGAAKDVTLTSETVTGISSTSSYTVSGTRKDGKKETKTATASVNFYNKYYFGCAADPGNITDYSPFIKKLTTKSTWASSRPTFTLTKSVNCPANNYVWLAYPSNLPASSFKVNGFNGNFEEPILVDFTNNSGYTEKYYLYRSTEHSLGLIDELVVY